MPEISEISFSGNNKLAPPKPDQIEISLFGPGYGEGLLLHVGDNNWLIVDSSIDPLSKQPTILDYLQEIGVDPSKRVKLVVATHWHDDHIRGLAEIYRRCELAEFVTSAALRSGEFLTLVNALGKRAMMETSGVQEFQNVLKVLEKRKLSGSISPIFAVADRLIWKKDISLYDNGFPCEVHSLSPSDESIRLALVEISSLLPEERQPKTRIVAQKPNHTAVVLWVRIGDVRVLLGSDLENTGNRSTGWTLIINSKTRPEGKACVFKIPHHGSENADHPLIWSEMLEEDPISALCPFILGGNILPRKSDVKRICENTQYAFATTNVLSKRVKFEDKTVEKTVRETVKAMKYSNPSFGHVRVRSSSIQPPISWAIDLFRDALPLAEFY
jgi:beta-lactamase superfamily II metal-dependent hydrolase